MTSISSRAAEPEAAVRACLRRQGVPSRARVLVAISGGPDSTALLCALHRLADGRRLELAAAHFDHGLRPAVERAGERRVVRRLCAGLEVPLLSGRARPGSLTRRAGELRRRGA